MTPLTFARTGEENAVLRVGGNRETRRFLENIGFVPGARVSVVEETGGDVIVSVKESRVALSRRMAVNIMV
jgi:ferrous iron transport protein A